MIDFSKLREIQESGEDYLGCLWDENNEKFRYKGCWYDRSRHDCFDFLGNDKATEKQLYLLSKLYNEIRNRRGFEYIDKETSWTKEDRFLNSDFIVNFMIVEGIDVSKNYVSLMIDYLKNFLDGMDYMEKTKGLREKKEVYEI